MRKFEHSGDTNKKFQKKLDKGNIAKNKDSKIKKSKDRLDGEDFGKKYDELFNKYAKEYPKYQDPASVPFDINSQDSIDLFQKNSQIKEQIIARVTAELKKGETAPVTKESEVSKNIDIISRTEAPDIVSQLNEEPTREEPVVENQKIDKNEVTTENATIVKVMEENTPIKPIKKDPLSKKELETATIFDLQNRGYTTKDPEFDMVLKRGIIKTEARINRIANENNKETENEKSQKINMLFEMGGPQAGEILNVNENGKTFKYTILENDSKNIFFTIDGASEQKIGLHQIKEFLSKKGISFEFAGEPEKKVQDKKLAEVEEIGLTPEEEILYEQMQKEMDELEKDIEELKKGKEEFLLKESQKEIIPEPENPIVIDKEKLTPKTAALVDLLGVNNVEASINAINEQKESHKSMLEDNIDDLKKRGIEFLRYERAGEIIIEHGNQRTFYKDGKFNGFNEIEKGEIDTIEKNELKKEIEDIIKSKSENLKKKNLRYKNIDIDIQGKTILMEAVFEGTGLKGAFMGTPKFSCAIGIVNGEVKTDWHDFATNDLVGKFMSKEDNAGIKALADSLGGAVKDYIEEKSGRKIDHFNIENGALKVIYEKK